MKRIRQTGIFILICGMLLFCNMDSQAVRLSDAVISEGIYIGPVNVSGMTRKEAKSAVRKYIKSLKSESILLHYEGQTMKLKVGSLGFSWKNKDVVNKAVELGKTGNIIERYKSLKDLKVENKKYTLETKVKKSSIKKALEELRPMIDKEAVNANLSKEGDQFIIQEGQTGISLDVDSMEKEIQTAMGNSWDGKEISLDLQIKTIEPKATKEQLSLVKDVLGTFQTTYSTGSGRSQNVANGASKINGTLLFPGEEFSVYQTVSPFDAENGYELAGSYENGSVVQTYGGGICQVSTTLFNAVLFAELDVTQRSEHSMIVTYVEPSRDAAISGEYKDFKFVNNTDAPIYIEGTGVDGVLTFTIYGHETRPANRSIEFVSETLTETPPTTVLQASSQESIGTFTTVQKAHEGKTAQLWKVVYEDGVETSREVIFDSTYNMSPEIISIGTASPYPDAVSAMNAAIASGDLGNCQNIAATYAGAVVANTDAASGEISEEEQNLQNGDDSNQDAGDGKSKKKKKKTNE